METMETNKNVQALKLSDNELSTITSLDTTHVTSNDTNYSHYSPLWIFLIVLLSMLVIIALYWIFVFIIIPLTRKSSACRYILPCYKLHTDFLIPLMDVFLDVIHVSSGEQIRVFLKTIMVPPCSLSFTGSVKITNFQVSRNIYLLLYILIGIIVFYIIMNMSLTFLQKEQLFSFQPNSLISFSRPGPYNIQLVARHMDALLQIPHSLELDFVTASDLLTFPYRNPVNPTCPYQQIHDEVLTMMPLSDTPSASDPTQQDKVINLFHLKKTL